MGNFCSRSNGKKSKQEKNEAQGEALMETLSQEKRKESGGGAGRSCMGGEWTEAQPQGQQDGGGLWNCSGPPPGDLRLGVKFITHGHRDSVLSAVSC